MSHVFKSTNDLMAPLIGTHFKPVLQSSFSQVVCVRFSARLVHELSGQHLPDDRIAVINESESESESEPEQQMKYSVA